MLISGRKMLSRENNGARGVFQRGTREGTEKGVMKDFGRHGGCFLENSLGKCNDIGIL